ncbi:molybdopterin cofactor-binding domain-containing protein, partial [Roseomonas sp. DSM 102946]|nr:molybdopterin cofactor-binding domain-containing protein [Roseomonas sp. DSM 102946]
MAKFGLSQSLRRVEDPRLLKGEGRYTDDLAVAGTATGYLLRSPHAHATILSIDTADARAMPGVLAIYTAEELAADGIGPLPHAGSLKNRDGSRSANAPRFLLASGKVRHVGDPVAFVVAESLDAAKDAAEAILVDYDPLPACTDLAAANEPGQPQVFDDVPDNRVFDWEIGDKAKTDALFDSAAHVTRLTVVNNRIVVASMEGRAALAEYDAATERFTLQATSQGAWHLKDMLAEHVFKL